MLRMPPSMMNIGQPAANIRLCCSRYLPVCMPLAKSSALFLSAIHDDPSSYSHMMSPTGKVFTVCATPHRFTTSMSSRSHVSTNNTGEGETRLVLEPEWRQSALHVSLCFACAHPTKICLAALCHLCAAQRCTPPRSRAAGNTG